VTCPGPLQTLSRVPQAIFFFLDFFIPSPCFPSGVPAFAPLLFVSRYCYFFSRLFGIRSPVLGVFRRLFVLMIRAGPSLCGDSWSFIFSCSTREVHPFCCAGMLFIPLPTRRGPLFFFSSVFFSSFGSPGSFPGPRRCLTFCNVSPPRVARFF